jgi:hypothetical protein
LARHRCSLSGAASGLGFIRHAVEAPHFATQPPALTLPLQPGTLWVAVAARRRRGGVWPSTSHPWSAARRA